MDSEPAANSAAVVIVGPLNPMMFQPRWLAAEGLLSEQESEAIQNLILTPDFAQFTTEWLQLNATSDKLTLTTTLHPYFILLRDFASSLLDLLGQTPIAAIGLNSVAHFSLDSPDRWHRVGHTLAPKSGIWDDILEEPGTQRVAIQGERASRPGNVNIVVEPSARILNGIFIEVNDHFSSPTWPEPSSGWAQEILETEWSNHEENTNRIFKRLLSLGESPDQDETPGE